MRGGSMPRSFLVVKYNSRLLGHRRGLKLLYPIFQYALPLLKALLFHHTVVEERLQVFLFIERPFLRDQLLGQIETQTRSVAITQLLRQLLFLTRELLDLLRNGHDVLLNSAIGIVEHGEAGQPRNGLVRLIADQFHPRQARLGIRLDLSLLELDLLDLLLGIARLEDLDLLLVPHLFRGPLLLQLLQHLRRLLPAPVDAMSRAIQLLDL